MRKLFRKSKDARNDPPMQQAAQSYAQDQQPQQQQRPQHYQQYGAPQRYDSHLSISAQLTTPVLPTASYQRNSTASRCPSSSNPRTHRNQQRPSPHNLAKPDKDPQVVVKTLQGSWSSKETHW